MGTAGRVANVTVDCHHCGGSNIGERRWTIRASNLVTAEGREVVRNLLANYSFHPSYISLGTGSTDPHDGDVALEGEVFMNACTRIILEPALVKYQLYVDTTQANGYTISEVGLHAGSPQGSSDDADDVTPATSLLFARAILPEAIVKDNTVDFTVTWEVPIQSLEL